LIFIVDGLNKLSG